MSDKQTAAELRNKAIEIVSPISGWFVRLQRELMAADPIELAGKMTHDERQELINLFSRALSIVTIAQSRDISKPAQARRINGW